ncbi:MAG: 50S ribosomal protein L32 [Phycisphaerales bacterium]|nr:50S ribosomal protein L32 [Phycisphaerales bacterium]
MAVPALRTSPSRKRKRRSHHALRKTNLCACPACGSTKHPHAACRECGYVRPGLTIRSSGNE